MPPGWYPDESGYLRWWDGRTWGVYAPPASASQGTDGLAIAALILGITGIPVLPIVFGYKARRRIAESPVHKEGDGLALAGIIIGWVQLAFLLVGLIVFAVVIASDPSGY